MSNCDDLFLKSDQRKNIDKVDEIQLVVCVETKKVPLRTLQIVVLQSTLSSCPNMYISFLKESFVTYAF